MIDLDELERQAKEATPGPWVIRHGDGWYNKHSYEIEASDESHVAETLYAYNGEADAAYIVAACNSLPEVIAENRALRERVRELERQRDWLIHYAWIDTNAPCPYEMGDFDQKKICPYWTPYRDWEKAEDMSRDDWHDLLMEGVMTEEDKVNCGTDFCECLLRAAEHEAAKEAGE